MTSFKRGDIILVQMKIPQPARRWQKNGGRKMKFPRFAPNGGGGVYYLSDPDISDILFDKDRERILREP